MCQCDRCSTVKYFTDIFHCSPSYSFFSVESVKLNATRTETAHFIKDIRIEEPLGEESVELSDTQ
jgi:hypothetical protein